MTSQTGERAPAGGRLARYLPSGDELDDQAFDQRHTLLCWVLGLHVPLLLLFGLWQGTGTVAAVLEAAVPGACLVLARLVTGRRPQALLVASGLVAASTALAYMSGGTVEARFHVFLAVALVGLYRDRVVLAWAFAGTAVAYLIGAALDPDDLFDHPAAQDKPLLWAAVHLAAVLAACAVVALVWHVGEAERRRTVALVGEAAQADAAAARAQAAQSSTVSDLIVHLARRNQALLDRQLELIAELEQHESTPEALADLFRLDHLATRIRRNAESLLVLSGEDPPRRWGRPVPLGEVVRAAAAEVEDYDRVEALVDDQLDVEGRAVADLAHLLAELIENATAFSPPGAEVRVRSHVSGAGQATYVLSIEDTGPGMAPEALDAANRMLADPPSVDLAHGTLGFQVVARLARRYRLQVQLATTPGGGLTALIVLPANLISHRPVGPGAPGAPGATGAPLRPGQGPADWRLPDADPLGRMVAPTPPASRRGGESARELGGMAIPRIGAEPVTPGAAPAAGPPPDVPRPAVPDAPAFGPGTPAGGTPAYGTPPGASPAGGTPAYGTPPGGTPAGGTPVPGTPSHDRPPPDTPAGGIPPAPRLPGETGESPAVPPAPATPPAAAPVPAPPSVPPGPPPRPPGAERLIRRVPGEGLKARAGDDALAPDHRVAPAPPLDRERMRTMLSRLQGQRAARSGGGGARVPQTGSPPGGPPPDDDG